MSLTWQAKVGGILYVLICGEYMSSRSQKLSLLQYSSNYFLANMLKKKFVLIRVPFSCFRNMKYCVVISILVSVAIAVPRKYLGKLRELVKCFKQQPVALKVANP